MRLTSWLVGLLGVATSVCAAQPCRIEVVEQGDGWPVPGVELRTVHGVRFVSDNAGLIAWAARRGSRSSATATA